MTVTQPDLFAARADAIGRADDHADTEWKRAAYEAILKLAHLRLTFTSDDVWEALEGVEVATHEPSALGPVFLRASRAKQIKKTGRMVLSRRSVTHRDITIWERA